MVKRTIGKYSQRFTLPLPRDPTRRIQLLYFISVRVGSQDPFFGYNYFPGIDSAHTNNDSRH